MFDYQEGFLHLFFCNETDEFYLDSLLRFDLSRYLFYQLEKDEYEGIFFVQSRKNGGVIYTENQRSEKIIADFFGTKKTSSFFAQKKPEFRQVERGGRRVGSFDFRTFHEKEDEIARFIVKMLQKEPDSFAFVLPIKTFNSLYREEQRMSELASALENDRGRSVMIILCPMNAAECFQEIMSVKSAFNSALCPEIRKLINRKDGFLVFEELARTLGNCYHFCDQLGQAQLRKMLEYGVLFEDLDIGYDEIENLCNFIYLWYHSPQFAQRHKKMLPVNEWRDISKLRKWLLSGENTNSLRRAVKSETEGSEPGGALAAEAERQCRISETLNEPIYRKAHSYEELSRLDVESLTGGSENAGRTLDRYYEAVGMLRKLWSDNRENDTEVEYCIDQLKAVPSNLTYAGIPVEKIIMLLHYSVSSNDRKRDPDRFREKIGYYKQIVNLSFGVADNKSKIEALDDRIRRAGKKMLELSKEIKTLDDGTAAVQELLLPKKHQYLDLKNSQKRNGKYRTMLDLLVNKYEMEIDRLELVISAVGGDKIDYNASAEAQKAFQEMVMSVETTLKKFDKLDQEMEAAQDLLNETVEGQMDPVQELLDWSKTDQMEQSAEAELDELIRQLN